MPYTNNVSPPTQNTEGGTTPTAGTTGRYLFQDNTQIRTEQIFDGNCYPGQSLTVRETLTATYNIYDSKLVTALDRYYIPKYYLGTWQAIERNTSEGISREGKSRYLETVIQLDHTLVNGYMRQNGLTDYGLLELSQCNFSLFPGTPISFEIAGVEINFSTYEVPPAAGRLFQGKFAIDRAYPSINTRFRFPLSRVGFFTFQGAALQRLSYRVEQVNNVAAENRRYNTPPCPKF